MSECGIRRGFFFCYRIAHAAALVVLSGLLINCVETPRRQISARRGNTNTSTSADAGGMSGQMDAPSNGPDIDSGVLPNIDTGVFPDPQNMTNPDSGGTGPAGPCPTNYAGCRCTPTDPTGMADPDQGSCVDSAATCVPYADTLAICVYRCQSDSDCSGKTVGQLSSNRSAGLCRDFGDDGFGICVENQKVDDERCRLHALEGGSMDGCRLGANCTTLAADSPGEGTCLQVCLPTPQDPTGGCMAPLPFCNWSVFTRPDGSAMGICGDRSRPVGARCGGGYTKQCDTGAGELLCFTNEILDPSGQQPLFLSLALDEGFCVETCDPNVPSCPGTTDPATGSGQCLSLGTGAQGLIGICSHECNALTDQANLTHNLVVNRCSGMGSEGAGRNCFAFPPLTLNSMQGIFGQADLCLDVLAPPVAEAAVQAQPDSSMPMTFKPIPAMGTTPADCYSTGSNGEIFHCPTGTYCSNVGSQSTPIPACVRRCGTPHTVAMQPYVTDQCVNSTLPNSSNLVCVPFGKTSTAVISGDWMGFCAPAPN